MRDNETEQLSGEYVSAVPDADEPRRKEADEAFPVFPIRAAEEEDEETDKRRLPFLMAGIGASAGGVEAYINLFEQLPPDTGMAFVVILHLAPDLKSHLTEILARHSAMPVETIASGMEPRPNRIYVLPANARVRLSKCVFQLDSRAAEMPPHPIDDFLRSLANAQKNRAIGVVLSGMDGDGTLGLKAIKGEGGITIVQSPESARFPEMPLSSMAGDQVDMVLPPRAIAGHLAQLARQFNNPEIRTLDEGDRTPDDRFGKILALMKGVSGIDFRLYKPNTIRRRIVRRMLLRHVDTLPGY
jgi:two-component system CheB/CheR fusion protein